MKRKSRSDDTALPQIIYSWLRSLGNEVSLSFLTKDLTSHPDYPAMTSITDFLDSGNMPYRLLRADKTYISEFKYPLLAHFTKNNKSYLMKMASPASWNLVQNSIEDWTGVVLYPDGNTKWHNELNDKHAREQLLSSISVGLLAFISLVLYVLSTNVLVRNFSKFVAVFGLISIIGVFVSLLMILTELGYQSTVVKKVCGDAKGGGGCESVMNSKWGKGIAGVTVADISFIYFFTQFVFYLVSTFDSGFLNTLLFISRVGILFGIFSLVMQAYIIKQWCVLCLTIVSLLLVQGSISLGLFHIYTNLSPYLWYASVFFIILIIYIPIKKRISNSRSNALEVAAFRRWKADENLFIAQWKKQVSVDTSLWENDLIYPDANAPIRITVACNPYCNPCAESHAELDNLIARFGRKLSVQIRFACNDRDENDRRLQAVKAILRRREMVKDYSEVQEMLSDWFQFMDLEKWYQKWKPDPNIDVDSKIKRHCSWIAMHSIDHTPTIFVNGKLLPKRYSLPDLALLIPELADTVWD